MRYQVISDVAGSIATVIIAVCATLAIYWLYQGGPQSAIWPAVEAIATTVAALFAGGALYWAHQGVQQAVRTLQASADANKADQLMEVWQHCATRYDALKRDLAAFQMEDCARICAEEAAACGNDKEIGNDRKIIPKIELNEKLRAEFWRNFWSRYWGLKNDQFDFWLYGYLDHDTFCDWAFSTLNTFERRKTDKHFNENYRQYLENAGTINPMFDELIKRLRQIAMTSEAEADAELTRMAEKDPLARKQGLVIVRRSPHYNLMIAYITDHIVGREKSTSTWSKRHKLATLSWPGHLESVKEGTDL